ncbi:DUF2142 domain-containing protein [Cellulomonas fengjieae]|uniref:DUF2142 domain-containing protein n=1 Tax=Cellulomonas fengjieae TaxID=2819978 RepID=UPI001AAEBEA4|nr:DUF2142 domain-containing protein [Cellulomonas fengjieae]MBO3101402.1 DUF2142 domain-containing protein [Cellulomonas fengjieae]
MQPAPTVEPHATRLRAGGARPFWLAFGILFALTATWSLASPLASGPDENAHIVKAAGVVRGDLRGHSTPDNPGAGSVTVPYLYRFTLDYPACFAFRGAEPADCAPAMPEGDAAEVPTDTSTWVIRNNPLYYALVGTPTLLPPSTLNLYLMRLLSAALCSAVLAWGFREVLALRRRPLVTVGVVAALTPMVVYLNSTVNPSALEISAAVTLWVCLLALVRAPDPTRLRSRAAGVAVVAVLLANTRGLSPVWVALIALTVVAVGPWSGVRAVLTDRRSWPWLAVVVLGTGAALAWTFSAGTLEAGGADHPELGFLSTANRTFFDTGDFLVASIGRFGWLDTSLPQLVYMVYTALIGLPTLLALSLARRRDQLAMLVVIGVAVLVPTFLHAWQARSVGYIWTARYSIPLFVGVVVVAGFIGRDAVRGLPRWVEQRLVSTLVPLLAVGQLIAFLVNLRRYTVGDGGSWRQILSGEWAPPVPSVLLLLVQVGALAAGTWALTRPQPDLEPDVDPDDGPDVTPDERQPEAAAAR